MPAQAGIQRHTVKPPTRFWIPAFQAASQLSERQIFLSCHSGLDPRFDRLTALSKVEGESSSFSAPYNPGCRSKIPFLAGIKSGMTDRN
jgi:hypothetical protein